MIRRTLTALAAVLGLGLLFTLVYAMVGLSGPQTTVDDAVAAFEQAEYTRAIRLLDRAENSIAPNSDPELRGRILKLRKEAHLRVENRLRALADIRQLVALGEAHPRTIERLGIHQEDLRLELIYVTLLADERDEALRLAQEFLHDNPDHPRGLELAGEASYAVFAANYEEFREELGRRLDPEIANRADNALRVWLYRGETDPLAMRNRAQFDQLLEAHQSGTLPTATLIAKLDDLRRSIQRAQTYCRQALVEPGGQPVAAYKLLQTTLDKGRRDDDVQALAETYLLRYDHIYTVDAACDLAELHLSHGRYQAVVELADRFLPPGTWRARFDDARLSREVRRLFSAKARALMELKDRPGSVELATEVEEIQASGLLDLTPELHLVRAFTARTAGNLVPAMDEIDAYIGQLVNLPLTDSRRRELYSAFLFKRDIGKARNFLAPFFVWMTFRLANHTDHPVPHLLELTALHLDAGEPDLALNTIDNAASLEGHNDAVLQMRARVHDAIETNAGRGSSERLAHFLQLEKVPPTISNDLLWPRIAEVAIEKGHHDIALQCARRAAEAFNWAKWPRVLESRAALALGDPKRAALSAESLLSFYPNDPEALDLLRAARLAADESIDDLLFGSMLVDRSDPAIARALLEQARERGDDELADSYAQTLATKFKDDAASQLLLANYYLARGRDWFAQQAIDAAIKLVDSPAHPLYARSRASLLLVSAITQKTKDIDAQLEATKALLYGNTDELYRFAQLLEELGGRKPAQADMLYALAYDLMRPILNDAVHRLHRRGEHYVFGGKLAMRLMRTRDAKLHFRSALPTEDGRSDASRYLTLLHLQEGATQSPAETFWESEATDLVSASILAMSGKRIAAVRWAEDVLTKRPLDLPALCLIAMLEPTAEPPSQLVELVRDARESLLRALAFLEAEGFERTAVLETAALLQRFPDNPFAKFLLARAYANSGAYDQASQLLGALMGSGPEDEFLWANEEAARLIHERNLQGQEIVLRTISPIVLQSGSARVAVAAELNQVAIRALVDRMIQQPEQRDGALEVLAQIWRQRPENSTIADVDFLASNGRADLALEVLGELERVLPADQLPAAHERYFELVTEIDSTRPQPSLIADAMRRAERIVEEHGGYGSVVQFLLQHGQSDDLRPVGIGVSRSDPNRVRQETAWIRSHFRMFLEDRDTDTQNLLGSLRRFAQLVPRNHLIDTVDQLLRHVPSIPDIWLLRAQWLSEDGRIDEARESLRWVETYLPRHASMIRVVELAARAGEADTQAESMLRSRLGEAAIDAPGLAFTRGLLALRAADYARADREFAAAEPQADGSHLFFRALCKLALGDATAAAELLQSLGQDYPISSLAENAVDLASFASH